MDIDFKDLPPKTKEAARFILNKYYDVNPREELTYIISLDRWIFYIKFHGLITPEIELELIPIIYGINEETIK